jgi:two-component system sensor histidine kinase/response regulator
MDTSQNFPRSCRSLGLHVLLVDDSPTQRVLATSLLLKQGLDVTCAKDGKEAVDALEREEFDAVLMDVQMPVMDGLVATAEIRQRETTLQKHTPIIGLTSNADREKCFDAGMDGFALKPLNPKRVEQILGVVSLVKSQQN